jgi:hypothetical protein
VLTPIRIIPTFKRDLAEIGSEPPATLPPTTLDTKSVLKIRIREKVIDMREKKITKKTGLASVRILKSEDK